MDDAKLIGSEVHGVEPIDACFVGVRGPPEASLNTGQRHMRPRNDGDRGVQHRSGHGAAASLRMRGNGHRENCYD